MRNMLGTTNREERFRENEIISYADELYIVLKNYGTRGKVRVYDSLVQIDPFYWDYQGEEARRVIREDEE